MTILKGEKYIVESLSQFKDYLDVSDTEIAEAFPEDIQEWLLEEEADIARAEGYEPTGDLDNVPKEAIHQAVYDHNGFNSTIIDVLEARDREYAHLYDGTVHTIIEFHPRTEG
jgi:hypothetical protein